MTTIMGMKKVRFQSATQSDAMTLRADTVPWPLFGLIRDLWTSTSQSAKLPRDADLVKNLLDDLSESESKCLVALIELHSYCGEGENAVRALEPHAETINKIVSKWQGIRKGAS